MYTDTEGIIFRQVKTVNGRRMVLLFSEKYGKISAGTNISEKGKSKTALAMRPFTYGKYELYKSRDTYHINGADTIKSYYKIGEDVEKYMHCAYVLEFTEKMVPEEVPAPDLFRLLLEFFTVMERRTKKYAFMILAYQIKALQYSGTVPEIRSCALCGEEKDLMLFSVRDGGLICQNCFTNNKVKRNDTLIYKINFGIVNILRYILENPLKSFENLAMDDVLFKELQTVIRSYITYHLDIGELKSESFLTE